MSRRSPHHEDGCPFCAIASGADREVVLVAEATDWVAFFPPDPATRGHTLLIPRDHAEDFWALDDELSAVLAQAAGLLGRAIRHGLQPEGLNLVTSAGAAAEQTVMHVHLHLLPRWEDDDFGHIWPTGATGPTQGDPDDAEEIRRQLARG